MRSNSIRWRLSLTYGAISLLASISLGAILLFSLQEFYRQQETEYLLQNGRAIGNVLNGFLVEETDQPLIESQINTFAFLTQTRIELFDTDHNLIADSGSPDEQSGILTLGLQVTTDEGTQAFTQTLDPDGRAYEAEILIENGTQSIQSQAAVSGRTTLEEEFFTPLHLVGSALLDPAERVLRSDQDILISLGFDTFEEVGFLRLSEGPAYGRSIIQDVAVGLVVAGGLATLLTSLFGWWLSGRLAQPLNELANVTQRMGEGDLAARTTIKREDEIGRVARSFNRMAERINGTVSSLRRFVADAAHEISTPITALKGNLELLEPTIASENRHLLDQALTQTERIQSLSADLLQLSELDGAIPLEKNRLDFVALLFEQMERAAAEAEQAGIGFSQAFPNSPIWVIGHGASVLSLCQNLIDNALKFTPVGGTIDVRLAQVGENVRLTVADTGIGFNGDGGKLFERFYREPEVSAYAGNGLGLAICAKIGEQHGGWLSAESAAGRTVFIFQLPAER